MSRRSLQDSVQAALDELDADGGEAGLQAAVMKDGVLVADAQSGVADPASDDGRPRDPLGPVPGAFGETDRLPSTSATLV